MNPIADRLKTGVDIIKKQILSDIQNFSIPVKIEHAKWRVWMGLVLDAMDMPAAADDCRRGQSEYGYARMIAFEILYELGGYEAPLLCIPAALTGEKESTYWRAIAIAANCI